MRLTDATNAKDEAMLLNQYNFEAWLEEVQDQCLRKKATDQESKLAFLRLSLRTEHKNMLRAALAEERKKSETGDKLEPFTFAVNFLKKHVANGGRNNKEIKLQAEKLKLELGRLTIADCQMNLTIFHNKFHAKVEEIGLCGVQIDSDILSMYYQDGMRPHRELKYLTQDTEKRQGKTYFELYAAYKDALARNRTGAPQDSQHMGKSKATFSGTCNQCGKRGHKAVNCRSCKHCKKLGHSENRCWQLHPEQRQQQQ
jgi:hypothetical protein